MKTALFLPASIHSHILPTLYLADIVAREHQVIFAVTNDELYKLVVRAGYKAVFTESYRVGLGMENRFILERKRTNSRLAVLNCIFADEIFKFRVRELAKIIDEIKPSVVFVDIFNSTDVLVLFSLHRDVKIAFVNPMLSTFQIDGLPAVDEAYWPTKDRIDPKPYGDLIPSLKNVISNPFQYFFTKVIKWHFDWLMKREGLSQIHPVMKKTKNALLFENIPEIILAPRELEFSTDVQKRHQYYLGLCIRKFRRDDSIDASFDKTFRDIIQHKMDFGSKILYCSFGTFYQGSDKILLSFLTKLIESLKEIDNVTLVVSVNHRVKSLMQQQDSVPNFVHIFTRVPQLDVLDKTDLFITHGGLGSIKESIFYGVPMLVYPLDTRYDQNGNALKIEYYNLGKRGSLNFDRKSDVTSKIQSILFEARFKNNVRRFRDICLDNYRNIDSNTINQIVTTYGTN